ncbi:MAG: DUF4112 domain-containing protein [Verrucomicrobiales bacterium]|nr:DUF4112 domain-containing protein [Verrucomicrobiales bacterium]
MSAPDPDSAPLVPIPTDGSEEPASIREALERKAKTSRVIAWLLDECIRIPGTNIRFGLDPILGLVPGGGETITTVIGFFLLGEASRRGLPFRTLFKMGGNLMMNALIGAIPGVGDLFSFWFKSNSRNYALLRHYIESPDGRQASGGWWPLVFLLSLFGVAICINIGSWVLFIYLLHHFFGQ